VARLVSVRLQQLSSATSAAVYDVLMDVDRWAEWMPTVFAASWERHGAPGSGLGGVRRVGKGLNVTRDTVVGGSRPNHHAYAAAVPRFLPVTDYRGDIRIAERPNGSHIEWTVTCRSRIPGLDKWVRFQLRFVYTRVAAALAHEAERIGR
jgi:hypothetical protein